MSINFDVNALSPEDHDKFHRFIERLGEVVEEVFDIEADRPVIVVGVQFGEMGKEADNGLPRCLVTSNLPPCIVPEAIQDMLDFADAVHEAHHAAHADDYVTQEMDLANVPQEVIDEIKRQFGEDVDLSKVRFVQAVDISDLNEAEGVEEIEHQ